MSKSAIHNRKKRAVITWVITVAATCTLCFAMGWEREMYILALAMSTTATISCFPLRRS